MREAFTHYAWVPHSIGKHLPCRTVIPSLARMAEGRGRTPLLCVWTLGGRCETLPYQETERVLLTVGSVRRWRAQAQRDKESLGTEAVVASQLVASLWRICCNASFVFYVSSLVLKYCVAVF